MSKAAKCLAVALCAASFCTAAERGNLDIEFVKGLIAISSESRSIPECNRATAYLKAYLEKRGVHCHVERTEEGRDALYAATLPGKEHDYAFVTHIDVVPAADPSQFEPKIIGDEIWGRGACDTRVNAALRHLLSRRPRRAPARRARLARLRRRIP